MKPVSHYAISLDSYFFFFFVFYKSICKYTMHLSNVLIKNLVHSDIDFLRIYNMLSFYASIEMFLNIICTFRLNRKDGKNAVLYFYLNPYTIEVFPFILFEIVLCRARMKVWREVIGNFHLKNYFYLSFLIINERSRTLIRAKNMCCWYIHNIPRTGCELSHCNRRFDALRENLTVCQLLSFNTPCPAKRFCNEVKKTERKFIECIFSYRNSFWVY